MAITLVQSARGSAIFTTSGTATFAGTVTAGNTLLVEALAAYAGTFTPPSGFTELYSSSHSDATPSGMRTFLLASKVAGTADGTAYALSYTLNNFAFVVSEWSGLGTATLDAAIVFSDTSRPSVSWPAIPGQTTGGTQLMLLAGGNDDFLTDGDPLPGSPVTAFGTVNTSTRQFTVGYRTTTAAAPPYSYTGSITSGGMRGWHIALNAGGTPTVPGTATPGGELGGNTNFEGIGTAIGPYIASWRITRGASAEITGGAQVGQMTLLLNNTDNQFNPENASSPIIDLLTDGTPIWVGVNNDGRLSGTAVRGLFGGRVVDITPLPVPGRPHPPQVEITAEDELGRLGRVHVELEMSRDRSYSSLRQDVLEAAGVINYTLAPEIDTMPLSGADGFALGVLENINQVTGTRHFIEPADNADDWYTYTSRDRHWHLSGTAQGTLAGTAHVSSVSGWRRSADTVINQQRASFEPVEFTPASVTVWEAEAIPFDFTGTREFWIDFDDYVFGPIADVNYTGSSVTSGITAFGDTAKLTLTSAGTSTITGLAVEGSLARRAPAESYVANDEASQSEFRGVRTGSEISGDYVGVLANARGITEHIVWRYGSPQVRPTLTVSNWFPYQFDLDLFDLISFSSTELGVTNRLFEIVGLTHEGIHAGTDAILHNTTYVLQECRVQSTTNWFTTDVHAPNGSAILGY